jgi:hypothetical protein
MKALEAVLADQRANASESPDSPQTWRQTQHDEVGQRVGDSATAVRLVLVVLLSSGGSWVSLAQDCNEHGRIIAVHWVALTCECLNACQENRPPKTPHKSTCRIPKLCASATLDTSPFGNNPHSALRE